MACKRAGSNCKDCGLVEQPHLAWKQSGSSKIILLASSPKHQEVEDHAFQVNSAGKILLYCLKQAGLNLRAMKQTYVVPCEAPKDNEMTPEFKDAVQFCRVGLERELAGYVTNGATVIVAIGEMAAASQGIEGKILKNRGSVFQRTIADKQVYVIPVVDPDYIMKGNFVEELTMITDFQKAQRISHDGWKPPAENFVTHPTIEWLEDKLEELRKQEPKPLLACDTEGWIGGWSKHWMTGFATSATDAFCIPWRKQGGGLYWESLNEQLRAQDVLAALCGEFPLMFQNAQFDVMVLKGLGIECKHITHDTMLAHHVFHPELKHDLGYIASIYADTPYWKDIVLASEAHFNLHDDTMFRTYNMRDCVVLHQILPPLIEDLKKAELYDVYEKIAVRLVRPTVEMQFNGMRLLKSRIPQWQENIDHNYEKAITELRTFVGAPETFSPSSPYHMRWVFFGSKPASYADKRAILLSYDEPGTRKKRTTAAYQELRAATETIETVKPLARVQGELMTTAGGALATNKQSLNKMRMTANREIEHLAGLKRSKVEQLKRIDDLLQVVGVIDRVLNWSRWNKLKTTYYDFKGEADGRIHPSYPIHRTRTGRLASKNPNWQNLPAEVTTLFGPSKGYCLIKPDWSNIEMRVLAFASDDTVLQRQFNEGKKIHNENTKILFGVDETHPKFDTYKRAAKTYIFGRGYGGGLPGIFERVSMQVPEAKLTFEQFKQADYNYRRAHPAYVEWANDLTAAVGTTRTCVNAFGRRRIFLGTDAAIKREVLNTPIQSTAADIANKCLIEIQDWIDLNKTSARLVTQIHDAIMIECKLEEADKVKDMMIAIMEQEFVVWTHRTKFPVDVEICGGDYPLQETLEDGSIHHFTSSSWGEMVKWQEWDDARRHSTSRVSKTAKRSGKWNDEWGNDEEEEENDAAASSSYRRTN